MGLGLGTGRQALPTQACHLPQAGEGGLQAATLLGAGPAALQRLLHPGLAHVQQGIQRELVEDLLRKQGTGRELGEQPAAPAPPSSSSWSGPVSPLSGRGQLLAGQPRTKSEHVSEGRGSRLSPPPRVPRGGS